MNKKIILPILAVIFLGVAVFGISQVNAQTVGPFPVLAQMIAQKFGLDQKQVQAVIDQYKGQQKTNMQQNIQKRLENRLNNAVQQGKLSDAQKKAILDELVTLRSKYNPDSIKNMTQDQRKQQFQAEQNEIKSWASSQGIDPTYLMPGLYKKGMRGFGGFRHKSSITPSPTQ